MENDKLKLKRNLKNDLPDIVLMLIAFLDRLFSG